MNVFVYGTLKRGECRHHHLGDAKWLGRCRTREAFRLFDCGSYPGMVRGAGCSIEGELWEVDDSRLSELDEVEGVDERLYERVEIAVDMIDLQVDFDEQGRGNRAWTYLYLRPTTGMRELVDRWPG